MKVIGIDPGLNGAVAVLDFNRHCLSVHRTPVIQEKDEKIQYDCSAMVELLRHDGIVVMEQVAARPGQGTVRMFRFGWGVGLWVGMVAALGLPYQMVRPQEWKKSLGLIGMDKDARRAKARELFPHCRGWFRRKKDDGRAEACLIALYGVDRQLWPQTVRFIPVQ